MTVSLNVQDLNYSTSKKVWTSLGFVLPPVVSVAEAVFSSVSLLKLNVKKKVKLEKILIHGFQNKLSCCLHVHLLNNLKQNKELLRSHDITTHQEALEKIVSKSLKFKDKDDIDEIKNDPSCKDYADLLDEEFFRILTTQSPHGKLLNMKVEDLIKKFNKKKNSIDECETQIIQMTKRIERKNKTFSRKISQFGKRQIILEGRLRKLDDIEEKTSKNEKGKEKRTFSVLSNISQSMPQEVEDTFSCDNATLQMMENGLNEIDDQIYNASVGVIKSFSDIRTQFKGYLNQIKKNDSEVRKKFEVAIRELEVDKLIKQIDVEIYKNGQSQIFDILRLRFAKKEAKKRLLHALWCASFLGAYPGGIYELAKSKKIKQKEGLLIRA